ncbi:Uncharacterized protein APZ42_001549, partial [Daphnia magna]
ETTAKSLKSVFFSIIMDFETDVNVHKQLAIMVEFYKVGKSQTIEELLDLAQCEDGKIASILKKFASFTETNEYSAGKVYNFCFEAKFVGSSSDTCNTMFGRNHSVTSLLEKIFPRLLAVKYSCHSFHLCASYASKNLPLFLKTSLRWFYNHFSRRSGRRKVFAEFQKCVNVEPHAKLKNSDTRWLAYEAG